LSLIEIKIDVQELSIGMFVSKLDRPWEETPYPLQGFFVSDERHKEKLAKYCQFVFIDTVKGSKPKKDQLNTSVVSHTDSEHVIKPRLVVSTSKASRKSKYRPLQRTNTDARAEKSTPLSVREKYYKITQPVERELEQVEVLHNQVYRAMNSVLNQIETNLTERGARETKRIASAMVDSIIRNPDAFPWLVRIKRKDDHIYDHSIRASIWAIVFGRYIGLPKAELDILSTAMLLKDIGKVDIPISILEKESRTKVEQLEYESFVQKSLDALVNLKGVKSRVYAVVRTHCERINGSGFPDHLRGESIPLLGRIAGIVTYYDEIMYPRNGPTMSSTKAVAQLYKTAGNVFSEDFVVTFIRAIGLYPTGSLVELSTGEIAVVIEQHAKRRLKPKVLCVTTKETEPTVGMKVDDEFKVARIVSDVNPNTYDLDLKNIRSVSDQKEEKVSLLSFIKDNFFSD